MASRVSNRSLWTASPLEAVEEARGTGILVAVALGTHAAPELVPSQQD